MISSDMKEFLEDNPDWYDKYQKDRLCNCEHEKIEEHLCPFDQDTCNCCAYCQGQCEKLKA